MGNAILMIAVTVVVILGFFMMKRIDVFLEENKKVIEKEQEKKEETYIRLKFPETENDKNMMSEMEECKRTHHEVTIAIFDTDNQELADAITDYIGRM